jgi:hypothetical protein
MTDKTNSWVRAVVTLDIAVSGPWGASATNDQMINDAKSAARNIIQDIVQSNRGASAVGEPVFKVVTVFPENQK